MGVFKTFIFTLCVIVIPLLAILYLVQKKNYEEFLQSDPKLNAVLDKFEAFFKKDTYWEYPLSKLNDIDIMSDVTFYRGEKSYTINKEIVYICLKDENGEYYNENMLIYVVAHELAHVLCEEIGHTDSFHEIFDSLIQKLTQEGIYNPSIPVIKNYCKNGDPEL
jgi:hypothetical protein